MTHGILVIELVENIMYR